MCLTSNRLGVCEGGALLGGLVLLLVAFDNFLSPASPAVRWQVGQPGGLFDASLLSGSEAPPYYS